MSAPITTLRPGHVWTDYERHLREAVAYFERGQIKAAIISVAYASTLPDSKRPDELTRRNLFRQVTDAARAWDS